MMSPEFDVPGIRDDSEFAAWRSRWHARLEQQPQSRAAASELMRASNPAVIPRNHQVEAALTVATEHGDLEITERLLAVLRSPYDQAIDGSEFTAPPLDGGHAYQTY